MLQQGSQQREFTPRQFDRRPVEPHFAGRSHERKSTVIQPVCTAPRSAPQQGVEPGNKFVQVEWLQHVVIGPGLQTRDAVLHGIACGEHQHGQVLLARSPASQQGHAVLVGQSQIQNADVERSVVVCRLCGACRAHVVHGQAMQLETRDDAGRDQFVIFDKEHMREAGGVSAGSAGGRGS